MKNALLYTTKFMLISNSFQNDWKEYDDFISKHHYGKFLAQLAPVVSSSLANVESDKALHSLLNTYNADDPTEDFGHGLVIYAWTKFSDYLENSYHHLLVMDTKRLATSNATFLHKSNIPNSHGFPFRSDERVKALGKKLNIQLYIKLQALMPYLNLNLIYKPVAVKLKKNDPQMLAVHVDKKHNRVQIEPVSEQLVIGFLNYMKTNSQSLAKQFERLVMKFVSGKDTFFYPHKAKTFKFHHTYGGYKYHVQKSA